MAGFSRSAFCHETDLDHGGASGEDVTEAQDGSPERDMDVTSQPRAAAALQMREPGEWLANGDFVLVEERDGGIPRNPLPPATTIFFLAIMSTAECCGKVDCVSIMIRFREVLGMQGLIEPYGS